MRTEQELTDIYLRHCRLVWNICYPYFLQRADTEDAVQETFLRLAASDKAFSDPMQERAWLIVTARNICKDELKKARRRNLPLEDAQMPAAAPPEADDVMSALHKLPEQYRTVLYLYYYEGYSTAQIARLLHKPDASVRSDLRRGRKRMKDLLEGETV